MKFLKEIQEAYKNNNLLPVSKSFSRVTGNDQMVCPLTALAIEDDILTFSEALSVNDEENDENIVYVWATQKYGKKFVNGFIDGYDGVVEEIFDVEYLGGYILGKQVADHHLNLELEWSS